MAKIEYSNAKMVIDDNDDKILLVYTQKSIEGKRRRYREFIKFSQLLNELLRMNINILRVDNMKDVEKAILMSNETQKLIEVRYRGEIIGFKYYGLSIIHSDEALQRKETNEEGRIIVYEKHLGIKF